MASLNLVQIIGRLGRDPELRYGQSGGAVANFNVATDESYNDRDGNKVERTEWHRITVFGRMAENCANFLTKGSLVYVEGSLTTRKWQDQNGQDRFTTEIKAQRVQFLDRQGGQDDGQQQRQGRQTQTRRQQGRNMMDDDLGPAFPSEARNMDEVPFS